jgi:predicted nucleotidyltransferase
VTHSIAQPTAFPDLNEVLRELVSSVQAILGENFCGAYLQGSFAVGDADEHSDVDFIVVTHVAAPLSSASSDGSRTSTD